MGRPGPHPAEKTGTSRKQFMLLDGAPILLHTLRKFLACPVVDEILVALRPEDLGWFDDQLAQHGLTPAARPKPLRLVPGGEYRQDSVRSALAHVSHQVDLVAVHDAVRPFVTVELIQNVIAAAASTGAAILGIPPVDTVKRVERSLIRATLPRDRIALAQTPQVFRRELLQRAYEQAEQEGFVGTDEASLVEHLDVDVTVVMGSDRNIKITRPSDMALARLFLEEEKEQAAAPAATAAT
jgi:2-C-methyl-D-erythritol 4-phosphate cytidylyltransferase